MSCNSGETLSIATIRRFTPACVVLLAVMTPACGDDHGSTMNLPVTPTVVTPVLKVFTQISGQVEDGAFRPVGGVNVDIVGSSQVVASTVSDADGRYSLSESFAGVVTIRASKDGYIAASETIDLEHLERFRSRDRQGNPQVYFFLQSVVPPLKIEPGTYTLTVIADNACVEIPPQLRSRTYAATVQPSRDHPNTVYVVDLSGPTLGSFGFGLGVDGNYLAFFIDGGFFERLPDFTYLGIAGAAGASVETSPAGPIAIPFSGYFEYCALKSEMSPYPSCYATPRDQKIAYSQCFSNNDLMILERR